MCGYQVGWLYVVNRGHYFDAEYFKEETGLSDADKRALIELLKTM
jgi:hypothetical protein